MTTLKLHIPDMTCGHCVKTLTEAVQRLSPQATLQADLGTHAVEIGGVPDEAAALAAIRQAGYTPEPA